MANLKHLVHKKSNVANKVPVFSQDNSGITYGEIAVNYANGLEKLYIVNQSGGVVSFSSDNQFKTVNNETIIGSGNIETTSEEEVNELIENYMGSGITSARTVTDVIEENEEIVSSSLNDLNMRKLDKDDFDAHADDTDIHVTAADKSRWDSYSGGSSVSLNAPLSGINDAGLGNPSSTNQVIAWNGTSWEYQTNGSGSVTLNQPLAGINSAGLGTPSSANQVVAWNGTSWVYQTNNTGVPVDSTSVTKWNNAASTISSHTANTSIHVDSTATTKWNNAASTISSHTANTSIHVDSTAKTKWDNAATAIGTHSADTSIHVTTADKTKWNNAASGFTEFGLGSVSGISANYTNHKLNMSATTNTVITNGYQPSPMNATSAYTNESGATTSADYDGILPTTGNHNVNDMLKLLEQEIINLWKLIGKKDFDKNHYGETIYDIIRDNEVVTSEALNDLNSRILFA